MKIKTLNLYFKIIAVKGISYVKKKEIPYLRNTQKSQSFEKSYFKRIIVRKIILEFFFKCGVFF